MKNKKLVKGIVAGGLGLALLLGGGTFALWYQSDSVETGSITSGQLGFTVDDAKWYYHGNDTGTTVATVAHSTEMTGDDPSTFTMVPGDTVIYQTTVHVTAVGTDLTAQLTAGLNNITGDSGLAAAIKGSNKTTVTVGTQAPAIGTTTTFAVSPTSTLDFPVTVTLHFPAYKDGDTDTTPTTRADWWNQDDQGKTITLGNLTLDLVQTLS